MKSSPSNRLGLVLHENKSQGVLYSFQELSRRWIERQKRFKVIGGELHGQMLTEHEISVSKWASFYHRYVAATSDPEYRNIWVYVNV